MLPTEIYKFLAFTVSKVPAAKFQSAARKLLDEGKWNWEFAQTALDLNLVCPPPAAPFGGAHYPKYVIWEPRAANGSVFFSNRQDGWPTLIGNVSRLLPEPFVQVRISNDYETHAVCSMSYWVNGVNTRYILVLQDTKWGFFQEGAVLPFENPEYYTKHRIRERLTKTILIEYFKRLGWDINDSGFWETNSAGFYGKQTAWDHELPHP